MTWPFAVEKPKKKMLSRKGGLKMGEDERKGRGAAPFVLWFCFPREQRLGEDDWKWGLKVKRGGAAGLCEQGTGVFRPPLFSLNFFLQAL